MRSFLLRLSVFCFVALGLSHCGPDTVAVLVHVKNLPPGIAALQATVHLDCKPAQQGAEFSQQFDQLGVTVPKSAIVDGHLVIEVRAVDSDRCVISQGRIDTTVRPDIAYSEAEVSLSPLVVPFCTLTVEQSGLGTITPTMGGVVHSPATDASCGLPASVPCTLPGVCDFPKGQTVTLTATVATPFTMAFWEGDCSETKDSCDVTMTQARRVGVQWVPEVRPKMIRVPKGTFMMGSTGALEPERQSDEAQHSVTLTTDFAMAETEVTQQQYRNLMGSNPSYFMGDELPVEQVSWLDAVTYCNALSVKEKLPPCYQIDGTNVAWKDGVKCLGYRLPTEAEWEYAARVPTDQKYAGSGNVDAVAWYASNAANTTHAVKTKQANGRRLYDLSGNVWEWVWDWYLANYETLTFVDPIGPPSGSVRVYRGGGWHNPAAYARVAIRFSYTPGDRFWDLGFRLSRSYP